MRTPPAPTPTPLRAIGTAALAALLTLTGAAAATAAPAPTPALGEIRGVQDADAVPGRYVVAMDGTPSPAAAASDVRSRAAELVAAHGGAVGQVYSSALRGFVLSATEAQARRIAAAPGIRYVQADKTVHLTGSQANPPSWGLDRIDGAKDSTYTYPNDGSGVTIYVVDTGVYLQHPSFEGRATSGYDFIDNDSDASDCQGHGTHTAGTTGSKEYGVAKKAKIVSVRVLNCSGTGTSSQIAAGMDWVARNHSGPAVANLSLAGSADTVMDDAVTGAINAGVTVAIAAGNDSKDACSTSPARVAAAITLGSTDSNDARSSFSNYGSCLDLFAPGGSIVSTKNGGGSATMSGTSMATPHAAGAAALYLSAHPGATPKQVRDALVAAAASGVVTGAGSGSPNKLLIVNGLGGTTPQPGNPVADFTATCANSGLGCAFDASASTDADGSIASYAWDFGDGTTGTAVKPSHTYAAAGTFTVKLTVTDNSGLTGSTSKQVTAGSTPPPTGNAPKASLVASCWYQDCTFDATGSTDPDGDIASYSWKFGDSTGATGATVSHRYPAGQGTYTAQLTVTDRTGLTGTTTRSIACYPMGASALCFAG
ncbi:S8 family serine peptidase [Kitasatospora sp. NBC_01539]|uniref:S8 family serine peptidase n=1 Tax=Kitasatospora sp. NBC_01539 TaxID=2903577 RepID=UPI00386031FE